MNTDQLNAELLAVAAKIKAKGWQSASIDVYVSFLAVFDLPPGPYERTVSYRPSIRATAHRPDGSFYGSGTSQEYVADAWDIKDMDQAIAKLHATADTMPTMAEEAKRIDAAKDKLSDSERRLLGVR